MSTNPEKRTEMENWWRMSRSKVGPEYFTSNLGIKSEAQKHNNRQNTGNFEHREKIWEVPMKLAS